MAIQVAATSKAIGSIVDSLPGAALTEQEQLDALEKLEQENHELGRQIEESTKDLEKTQKNILQQLNSTYAPIFVSNPPPTNTNENLKAEII